MARRFRVEIWEKLWDKELGNVISGEVSVSKLKSFIQNLLFYQRDDILQDINMALKRNGFVIRLGSVDKISIDTLFKTILKEIKEVNHDKER